MTRCCTHSKSPALPSESEAVLSFLRRINGDQKLVAPICRGSLLVATSGIVRNRMTGFHLHHQYPDVVVRPTVEKFGGVWSEDKPVVVDRNLISSRHPDDMPHASRVAYGSPDPGLLKNTRSRRESTSRATARTPASCSGGARSASSIRPVATRSPTISGRRWTRQARPALFVAPAR